MTKRPDVVLYVNGIALAVLELKRSTISSEIASLDLRRREGMAFVRYKTVKGKKYYQLVRNCREGGRHWQQVLCHLGTHDSLEAAIEAEKQKAAPDIERYRTAASYWHERAATERRLLWRKWGRELLSEPDARLRWRKLWRESETQQDPERYDDEWDRERELAYRSLKYYEAKDDAAYYEKRALGCLDKLNKLRELQQQYS